MKRSWPQSRIQRISAACSLSARPNLVYRPAHDVMIIYRGLGILSFLIRNHKRCGTNRMQSRLSITLLRPLGLWAQIQSRCAIATLLSYVAAEIGDMTFLGSTSSKPMEPGLGGSNRNFELESHSLHTTLCTLVFADISLSSSARFDRCGR